MRFVSNQKRMIEPTLIDLHPNKYTQELHHYSFAVKLASFARSSSTLNDLLKSKRAQHSYRNK